MQIAKNLLFIVLIFFIYSCSPEIRGPEGEEGCPEKIASMSLASDEVLLEIITDKRIIGVTYLSGNENLSNVYSKSGSIPNKLRPNLEQIISIKPDLVIVTDYIDFGFLNQIQKSGIGLLQLNDFNSIRNIRNNILEIGSAVCETVATDRLVLEMDRKIEEIRRRKHAVEPTVLYLFPSYFTSGENTTIGEMIEIAGGINIGSQAGIKGNKKISKEYIIEKDPDIIIIGTYSTDGVDFRENVLTDKVLKDLSAIKNGHVYQIETKHLTTVSHHIVKGIEDLSQIIISYNKKIDADKKKTPN